MNQKSEKTVLCGASAYTEKYYLNDEFQALPDAIKDELKIMCVLYTNDEIGSVLKIRELQRTKGELLESLELYYKVAILGIDASTMAMDEE